MWLKTRLNWSKGNPQDGRGLSRDAYAFIAGLLSHVRGMAVCLAAGLDGIEKGMTPPPEITENIFSMSAADREARGIQSLPGTLRDAVECLRADDVICAALGEHVLSQYVEGKLKEWDAYRTHVSRWEIDRYLVLY